MKRFLCVLAVCLLVAAFAFAEDDLAEMVSGHNLRTPICAAMQLTGKPEYEADGSRATFDISENLHDIFFLKDGKVSGFGCVCTDPAEEIEFLAQCVTACYNFCGLAAGDTCFDTILSDFMFSRSGNSLGSSTSVPGVMIDLSKESFGYVFMMTRIN